MNEINNIKRLIQGGEISAEAALELRDWITENVQKPTGSSTQDDSGDHPPPPPPRK